jgi:hypothetical protein
VQRTVAWAGRPDTRPAPLKIRRFARAPDLPGTVRLALRCALPAVICGGRSPWRRLPTFANAFLRCGEPFREPGTVPA